MSIIEKMTKIVNDGDAAGAEQLIHDDYQFLMHSTGKSLSKKDVVGWVGMKDVKKSNLRVLFENNEVGGSYFIKWLYLSSPLAKMA